MKNPSLEFATILRKTAKRLEEGADYNWCHMGRCNCGHIAQTVTSLSPAQIHEMALLKSGDWRDQSIEHCTSTGYTIDHIIETILSFGLTRQDLAHIERLSDSRVLNRMDMERRIQLDYRNREDVIHYMRTWAHLIEETLLESVPINDSLLEKQSVEQVTSPKEFLLV